MRVTYRRLKGIKFNCRKTQNARMNGGKRQRRKGETESREGKEE